MLNIVIGRASSGKTDGIYDRIKALSDEKKGGSILIVPEQFSHEAEREMCRRCGNSVSLYSEVLSFSRLCSRVFSETGGLAEKTLDGAGRMLLMALALKTASPALKIYNLGSRRPEFLKRLIETKDEFRAAGAGYEEIASAAEGAEGDFGDKLRDLSAIFQTYDGLMPENMEDPYDRLSRLGRQIGKSSLGCGQVFVDGFTDFTFQEITIIEKLLEKCEDMTVCLTCDDLFGLESQFEIARETAARLINIAMKTGTEYTIHIKETKDTGKPESLSHLEKYLFSDSGPVFEGDSREVILKVAETTAEECENAAAFAVRTVRETGCRWRDISIAVSDWSEYRSVARGIFEKYGVPVYTYDKEDIMQKPVITLITSALDIIAGGWEYGDVFRYLKTDLSGMDMEERDLLENYVYMWSIRGESLWCRDEDWTASPEGYDGTGGGEDVLGEINRLRKKAAQPIYRLSCRLREEDRADRKVEAIYDFTEDIGLFGRIEERMERLNGEGSLQEADEYSQLWGVLVSAMEQCAEVLGSTEMENDEFIRLFKLLLGQYEVGTIPASVDCVNVGDLTRTRNRNVKYAAVLGASDDKMPSFAPFGGVLSDSERDRLNDWGIEIEGTAQRRLDRQMGAIYTALTLPKRAVMVSYSSKLGNSRPSFVFTALEELFGKKAEPVTDEIKREAERPLFELASAGDAAAREYFRAEEAWRLKLELAEKAAAVPRGRLSESLAGRLYSKNINITASRVDKYASCKFAYFLRYGLRAKPRTKAEFEAPQAGTFIHYILENVTRDILALGGFGAVEDSEAESLVKKYTEEYIENALDGFKDKSDRFIYLFRRLAGDAVSIVRAMAEELKKSDFVPLDFELDFSRAGDLPPAVVENGGESVTVNGKVDRVDGWINGGKLYVRVVDYKTGLKEFSLSDVLSGLGLQMLIYLFVLEKEGRARYGKEVVPAGVLYMPARDVVLSMDRSSSDGEIEKERLKRLKRKGLILGDREVIEAMEHGASPQYIPVKFSRDGVPAGDSIASIEAFGALSRHIDKILLDMGRGLRGGNIAADPYFKNSLDNACAYCDYYEACHFGEDKGDRRRYLSRLSAPEAWKKIKEGGGGI